jgi:hypothetical protein
MTANAAAAASEVRPPVIKGAVPADYRGPLYYRLFTFQFHAAKKSLLEMTSFASPAMGQRLASVNKYHAAVRKARGLCDEDGNLLPDLRSPVRARLKASANKSWDEFSISTVIMVSPRIRDVIESAAPGVHYFVPIDIDDRAGGTFRVYAFYPGLTHRLPAVALDANGIAYKMSDDGQPLFQYPVELTTTDRFFWLNASVIDGVPLLFDGKLSFLFSHELVQQLGDCLPQGTAFVPMGLV